MTDKEKLQNVELLLLKKKINATQAVIYHLNREAEKNYKNLNPEVEGENVILTLNKQDFAKLRTFLQELKSFNFSDSLVKDYVCQIDEIDSILREVNKQ